MTALDQAMIGDCVTVVALTGELDAHNADRVRNDIGDAAPAASIRLDLANVSFIDSAGLGALIGGIRRIREAGGTVTITNARRSVQRLLETTGVDRLAVLEAL